MTRERYTHLDSDHPPLGARAVMRWAVWDRLIGRRKIAPPGPGAAKIDADLERIHDPQGPPRLTWLGHAGFLGTLGGCHFLVDPVFSRRIGWLYRRYSPPPLAAADLPPLAALLITHTHYDHLDEPSIKALPRQTPTFVPLGLGRWFARRGFRQVTELGWWQSARSGALEITFVPARHWSKRTPFDTNTVLWGGFVVAAAGVAVYHAGDTAWFDGFAEIGRRFPALAAAMLPIGAYAPAWFMEYNHMNPEQAGRAFLELGARLFLPMHWGCFQLTDEPISEPVERLRQWWLANDPGDDRQLLIGAVGEPHSLTGDRDESSLQRFE